jgi:hypothetical protein
MPWIPLVAAGVGAAGSIAGGIIGSNAAKAGFDRQAGLLQKGADRIEGVNVPSIDEQLLALERLKLSGQLTPEQEQIINQKASELQKIKTDPALRDAQYAALNKLQQIGNEGGLTVTDRAQLEDIKNASNQQEQSNRNAILQNAAQRGMSGSGLQIAAELAGQQGAATRASQAGFQVGAQAQQRALQALMAAGQQGQAMQSADFNQQSQIAQASDAINRFNAANQQSVGQRNTDRANTAQQYNLNRQDLQDTTNNEIANKQQIANKGLYQTNYNNQLDKAKGAASAYTGQGQAAVSAGQQQANMWSNIGGAVGKLGSGTADYLAGQDKKKSNDDNPFSNIG